MAFAGWLLAVLSVHAHAAGTSAGTVINNTATLSYSIGGNPEAPVTSLPVSIQVDEVLDVTLTWQDAASVPVSSPDSDDPLTFVLTNTGNGTEQFALSRNDALAGDNYDPLTGSAGAIFLESGVSPGLQTSGPDADALYTPGANDPNLLADQSQLIYVVSDTPAGLAGGDTGRVRLTVDAVTTGAAGAAPGTTLAGLGADGVDAVVGTSQAQAGAIGTYLASNVAVSVVKTVASVVDPRGGSNVEPGSVLTYRITVTLTGTGTVNNLVVTDPLPVEVSYVAGGLRVNGATRSDATDADNGQFSANTITVDFGNTASPIVHVIEFSATIN